MQFEGCVDLFEIGAQEIVEMLKKSNICSDLTVTTRNKGFAGIRWGQT